METGKKQKKKVAGAALAAAVLASAALTAYAADGSQPQSDGIQTQSMELTLRKDPSYILTIPESQSIAFGAVDTKIGKLSVTGNIGTKQEVCVSVDMTDFIDTADDSNHFSFELFSGNTLFSEKAWGSLEVKEEDPSVELTVRIPSETWGETSPGTYRAVLTFQAELVDIE